MNIVMSPGMLGKDQPVGDCREEGLLRDWGSAIAVSVTPGGRRKTATVTAKSVPDPIGDKKSARPRTAPARTIIVPQSLRKVHVVALPCMCYPLPLCCQSLLKEGLGASHVPGEATGC
jgi:hypothetical protein